MHNHGPVSTVGKHLQWLTKKKEKKKVKQKTNQCICKYKLSGSDFEILQSFRLEKLLRIEYCEKLH